MFFRRYGVLPSPSRDLGRRRNLVAAVNDDPSARKAFRKLCGALSLPIGVLTDTDPKWGRRARPEVCAKRAPFWNKPARIKFFIEDSLIFTKMETRWGGRENGHLIGEKERHPVVRIGKAVACNDVITKKRKNCSREYFPSVLLFSRGHHVSLSFFVPKFPAILFGWTDFSGSGAGPGREGCCAIHHYPDAPDLR